MRVLTLTIGAVLVLATAWLFLRERPDGQRPLSHPTANAAMEDRDVLAPAPLLPVPDAPRAAVDEEHAEEDTLPSCRPDEDASDEIEWDVIEEQSDAELLELAGLPTGTPLSPRLNRPGPPDPLEPGDATLILRLFDQAQGQPFASHVVLWQLNAPANVYWTAGDQDVAQAQVGVSGHEFPKLAAGEYRAFVLGEQADAPHQPRFFVSGETEVTLFIEQPLDRLVRLTVVGISPPPRRMEAAFYPMQYRSTSELFPPWVRPRQVQPSYEGLIFSESFGWETAELKPEWVLLRLTSVGFDLGAFPEDSRGHVCEQDVRLRTDDWSGLLELENKAPGELLEVQLDLSANPGDD